MCFYFDYPFQADGRDKVFSGLNSALSHWYKILYQLKLSLFFFSFKFTEFLKHQGVWMPPKVHAPSLSQANRKTVGVFQR